MNQRTTQCISTLPSLDNLLSVLVSLNTNSLSEPEIKTTNTLPILICAGDGRYPWLKNDLDSASPETCLPHHDVDDDADENKQCCCSSSMRCEVFARAMCYD